MKFEDLVPSYDLCKMIPRGEFRDSALVWYVRSKKVVARNPDIVNCIPAPTLVEIIGRLSVPMAHHVFWVYAQVEPGKKYSFGGIVSFAMECYFEELEEEEEKEDELS